ncbi:MAG TPA: hypothetical protein VF988_17740, partial [Verrucomicrobiae bacterium]
TGAVRICDTLPNAIRRYSRLKICATKAERIADAITYEISGLARPKVPLFSADAEIRMLEFSDVLPVTAWSSFLKMGMFPA